MRIYFDNCSLQRPLDDQSQPRIEQETEAIVRILSYCETVSLVSSEVLLIQINDASDLERRETTLGILNLATENIVTDETIEKRAQEIEKFGIKPIDALHLASAEAGQAEYFCTCDDKLLRKAKAQSDLKVRAVSPIELYEEITK